MQFQFPFYIWILIGIIIIIGHYSVWMTRRLGSNPVAVLAMLILLSYAKLLRTVITVFLFCTITTSLWTHIHSMALWWIIFTVYINTLLSSCLHSSFSYSYSYHHTTCYWYSGAMAAKDIGERELTILNAGLKILVGWCRDYRVQLFMMAYTAPYDVKYHFWTGMFLMLRCVLFLVFASNASTTNLLAITTTTLELLFLLEFLIEGSTQTGMLIFLKLCSSWI